MIWLDHQTFPLHRKTLLSLYVNVNVNVMGTQYEEEQDYTSTYFYLIIINK